MSVPFAPLGPARCWLACQLDRLLHELFVVVGGPDAETSGKPHLGLSGKCRLQFIQWHINQSGIDLRAASALEPRRTGELTDHRHGAGRRRLQRQHVAGVLEQHRRLMSRTAGQRMMFVEVELAPGGERRLGAINQLQHPAHRIIEDGLVK